MSDNVMREYLAAQQRIAQEDAPAFDRAKQDGRWYRTIGRHGENTIIYNAMGTDHPDGSNEWEFVTVGYLQAHGGGSGGGSGLTPSQYVAKVNGKSGNVTLTHEDVGALSATYTPPLATETTDGMITAAEKKAVSKLSFNGSHLEVSTPVVASQGLDVNNNHITGLSDPSLPDQAATKRYVDQAIAAVPRGNGGGGVAGVSSVNGRTGAVTLTASDVGAVDANYVSQAISRIPSQPQTTVNGKTGDVTLTYQDVGAAAALHDHQLASASGNGFMSAAQYTVVDSLAIAGLDLSVRKHLVATAGLDLNNQQLTGLAEPTAATHGATKGYVDTQVAAARMGGQGAPAGVASVNGKTGIVTLSADDVGAATKAYVDGKIVEAPVVSVNGKTGAVTLSADDVGATTKAYVDSAIAAIPAAPAAPVQSVNNKTGNVQLTAADVGAATQQHIHNVVTNEVNGFFPADKFGVIDGLSVVAGKLSSTLPITAPSATIEQQPTEGTHAANKTYVDSAIAAAKITGQGGTPVGVASVNGKTGAVTLAASDVGAATKADIQTAINAIPAQKVTSVNTKTGDVTLTASDVGAATATDIATAISGITYPVTSVAGKTGAVTLTAADVGAATTAYVDSKIAAIPAAPAAPVQSVNGKTGAVTISLDELGGQTAAQVNAAIAGIQHPVASVNGKTGAVTLSAKDIGAATSEDITKAVAAIPAAPVQSVNGQTGAVVIPKAGVGVDGLMSKEDYAKLAKVTSVPGGLVVADGLTVRGELTMAGNKVSGLGTPTDERDAATKGYVDAEITKVRGQGGTTALATATSNGLMSSVQYNAVSRLSVQADGLQVGEKLLTPNGIDAKQKAISNLLDPVADKDAATKWYVDQEIKKLPRADGGGAGPEPDDTVFASLVNAGLTLKDGPENPVPQLTNPPAFEQYKPIRAPYYNTPIAKITRNKEAIAAGERPYRSDYSRRNAFNADNSLFLTYRKDGYWFVNDAKTLKPIGDALPSMATDCEPIWSDTDPNVLWALPPYGEGCKLYEINVETRKVVKTYELQERLKAWWPDAGRCWTKSEGSPSRDGRYWCWIIETAGYEVRGIVVYDRVEDKFISHMNATVKPDHTSMSPSGKYAIVSWAYNEQLGTRAYTRNLTDKHPAATGNDPYIKLHTQSEHSDIAITKDGREVYVAADYTGTNGQIFMADLETGVRTNLLYMYDQGTATAYHISGKAYDAPGYVVVSTYQEHLGSDTEVNNLRNKPLMQWYHRKVFTISLEASPKYKVLAWADSDRLKHWPGNDGYWAEPQATVNNNLTRVMFNSSMNSTNVNDIECFMLAIPEGTFPSVKRKTDLKAYVKKDGSTAFTGNVDAGNHNVINLATPTADNHAATKKYVDEEIKKIPQGGGGGAARTGRVPGEIIAVLQWRGCSAGATPPAGAVLQPLGTLYNANFGSVKFAWPEVKAQDNFVVVLPDAGMYMCQLVAMNSSTQPIFLKDTQGTLDGFAGPMAESAAVPLGTGMTFTFGTNIPNRLIRLPIHCPGGARKQIPDIMAIISFVAPKSEIK